jgi:hypothetical protein
LRFRDIDVAYPGTKFLLNTRDKDDWLQSRLTHRQYAQKFILARGLAGVDDCLAIWSNDWDRHLEDVRNYFKDRPNDLVEFNIDTDDVQELIAQLPEFNLDPAAWMRTGATKPENATRNRAALDAFLANR